MSLVSVTLRLNSFVRCDVYKEALTVDNAIDIISQYDIVVDATDNVETRYLISGIHFVEQVDNFSSIFYVTWLFFRLLCGLRSSVSVRQCTPNGRSSKKGRVIHKVTHTTHTHTYRVFVHEQLTTYHFGTSGPCYRCLFPVPPPPETVTNCSDGGVLGVGTPSFFLPSCCKRTTTLALLNILIHMHPPLPSSFSSFSSGSHWSLSST